MTGKETLEMGPGLNSYNDNGDIGQLRHSRETLTVSQTTDDHYLLRMWPHLSWQAPRRYKHSQLFFRYKDNFSFQLLNHSELLNYDLNESQTFVLECWSCSTELHF